MMAKSTVSVAICDSYDKEKVYAAVKAAVEAIGGLESFARPEEKILVKPNFLYPSEEAKTVTTNPAVISAVLRLLHEGGFCNVIAGDSPASGSCRAAIEKLQLGEEDLFGAGIGEMNEEVLVANPSGRAAKEFYFAREVTECDAIIGVCKMKTHALERITGAVKNMFGLVCGRRKAACHVKYPTASEFAKMLADIHNATPQRLHIMDAVVAMEGNGPASGSPVKMNMIIASSDPVALDTVFSRLVYLQPSLVPTNVMGSIAGLGTMDENEIEIRLIENGEESFCDVKSLAAKYGNESFDVMREGEKFKTMLGILSKISGGNRRPVIDGSKCKKCGVCVDHCPVDGKGVSFKNGRNNPPVYDYKKCIRCYCCQELCPEHAIRVK